jgi:F-type H+-transporting ATPase subunit delta
LAAETSYAAGAAGRYATALFELAVEHKALDAVAKDLERLNAAIEASADLARMIKSPVLPRDAQAKAIAAVATRLGASALVGKLLGLLAAKRRLYALPQIVRAFMARLAAHRGETFAEVVSAEPLDPAQLSRIKTELARKAGRDVTVTTAVEPALLGGLVVKLGSRMYDASLRTKLTSLTLAMKEVG